MSYELEGLLLVGFEQKDQAKRFLDYFLFDTRPDFIEDVPEAEQHLVELVETMEYAESYEWVNENTLYLWFNFRDDPQYELEEIMQIARFFEIKSCYGSIGVDGGLLEYSVYNFMTHQMIYHEDEDTDIETYDDSLHQKLKECDSKQALELVLKYKNK